MAYWQNETRVLWLGVTTLLGAAWANMATATWSQLHAQIMLHTACLTIKAWHLCNYIEGSSLTLRAPLRPWSGLSATYKLAE